MAPCAIDGVTPAKRGVGKVPCSERRKEIKRRRHRRKKVGHFAKKLKTATVSETSTIAGKLRALTPGGQAIVDVWELEKR